VTTCQRDALAELEAQTIQVLRPFLNQCIPWTREQVALVNSRSGTACGHERRAS
jgi:hypothetical protein